MGQEIKGNKIHDTAIRVPSTYQRYRPRTWHNLSDPVDTPRPRTRSSPIPFVVVKRGHGRSLVRRTQGCGGHGYAGWRARRIGEQYLARVHRLFLLFLVEPVCHRLVGRVCLRRGLGQRLTGGRGRSCTQGGLGRYGRRRRRRERHGYWCGCGGGRTGREGSADRVGDACQERRGAFLAFRKSIERWRGGSGHEEGVREEGSR